MNKPIAWKYRTDTNSIPTPQVVIHKRTLMENIRDMAHFATENQLQLRPHIKTHKSIHILKMQLEHGAVGFTAATISEVEALLAAGGQQALFHDQPSVLIAFPIVGEHNLLRVKKLQEQAAMLLMIDSAFHLQQLEAFASGHKTSFDVLVKMDTGLGRCGIKPEKEPLLSLIQLSQTLQHVHIKGIMTHAGHAYGASSAKEVQEIGRYEGQKMAELGKASICGLRQDGNAINGRQARIGEHFFTVSVGSTPTVKHSGAVKGVTEIRPGNYVFYDRTQVHLGVVDWSRCALRVWSRVVSHPCEGRWIIDAGAKTLALDQGAHGRSGLAGYGAIVRHPHLSLTRLSEEHGVLEGETQHKLRIGDLIEIIPNHACPVVNLAQQLRVIKTNGQTTVWTVTASQKNY